MIRPSKSRSEPPPAALPPPRIPCPEWAIGRGYTRLAFAWRDPDRPPGQLLEVLERCAAHDASVRPQVAAAFLGVAALSLQRFEGTLLRVVAPDVAADLAALRGWTEGGKAPDVAQLRTRWQAILDTRPVRKHLESIEEGLEKGTSDSVRGQLAAARDVLEAVAACASAPLAQAFSDLTGATSRLFLVDASSRVGQAVRVALLDRWPEPPANVEEPPLPARIGG